tara:strand:- start:2372 stop:2827 length:456 start_codon:yes stop_codon:yes gene_type:complete
MINKILIFWTVTIIIILACICISFTLVNNKRKKEKKTPFSLIQFLNNDQPLTATNLLVGMSFGVVFGFIDNASLWIGLDTFKKHIPGSILVKSGWANTYSSTLAATIGTTVFFTLKHVLNVSHSPIWLNSFGILIGCILGLYVPKFISTLL